MQETFLDDEDWSIQWSGWHSQAADLLLRVSWADWLVPAPSSSPPDVATFRDASTQLPWLQFDHVHLPAATEGLPVGRVIAESDLGLGLFLSHGDVADSPSCLYVDEWQAPSVANSVTLLSCLGLLSTLTLCAPFRSYREVEPRLRCLRLLSDLVRGSLRLWSRGHSCVLIVTDLFCPGLAALGKVAPYTASHGSYKALGNVPCYTFLSLFL